MKHRMQNRRSNFGDINLQFTVSTANGKYLHYGSRAIQQNRAMDNSCYFPQLKMSRNMGKTLVSTSYSINNPINRSKESKENCNVRFLTSKHEERFEQFKWTL